MWMKYQLEAKVQGETKEELIFALSQLLMEIRDEGKTGDILQAGENHTFRATLEIK